MDARERAARIDLLSFQLGEIDKVQPLEDEDEQLAATRQVLANADRLQRLGQEAYQALYEDEHAALQSLSVVWKRLDELAHVDASVQPYAALRDGLKAQLDDLAFFLRQYVSDDRGVAGAAPGGRGSAGVARAAEAQVRPDPGRRAQPSAGAARPTGSAAATGGTALCPPGGGRAAAEAYLVRGAASSRPRAGARRHRSPPGCAASWPSCRCRTPTSRSGSRRPAAKGSGPRRESTAPSCCCRPTPARRPGRWRASRRAASCRA